MQNCKTALKIRYSKLGYVGSAVPEYGLLLTLLRRSFIGTKLINTIILHALNYKL